MALSLENVLQQLSDSGIIPPAKLQQFVPPRAQPASVEELLRSLIKQDHLTKFQAMQIAQGRTRSLILGGFTILDKIGAGGMGQVFKAEHRRMKRIVAIKTLPATTMKDPAAVARFQREVEVAAKLRHPNIVAADDADDFNGIHFLVMEYIEGQDLSNLVKSRGPIDVHRAVDFVVQAARGLKFAHGEGIVHRDIKPSNLLLDKNGVVKVLDMGLARINATDVDIATQAELTGSGTVMGTVDYMAPEQAISSKRADARADIYSLGCTLYYLITGKATYGGQTSFEKLLAHRDAPIPSLRAGKRDISEQLDAIFRKMVAKKVEDRYQTMAEVIGVFEMWQGNQPVVQLVSEVETSCDDEELETLRSSAMMRHLAPTKPEKSSSKREGTGRGSRNLIYAGVGAGILVVVLIASIVNRMNSREQSVATNAGAESHHVQTAKSPEFEQLATSVEPQAPVIVQKSLGQKTTATQESPNVEPARLAAPFTAVQARTAQESWAKWKGTRPERFNSISQKLVLIPPGEFEMGNEIPFDELMKLIPYAKPSWFDDAVCRHRVRITKPFFLGKHEVTIGEFRQFVNDANYQTDAEKDTWGGTGFESQTIKQDSKFTWKFTGFDPAPTNAHPVVNVSWSDAVHFCNWMSRKENKPEYYVISGNQISVGGGAGYRLPTEAEWEYACRAGTVTMYYNGDDQESLGEVANVADASYFAAKILSADLHPISAKDGYVFTAPVGQFAANNFGLHDMHGNVREWCEDLWAKDYYIDSPTDDPRGAKEGTHRVIRGGNWQGSSRCRSARRGKEMPNSRSCDQGFRVALQIE